MAFFDILLQTQGSLHPDGEPDDFISEYTGVTCLITLRLSSARSNADCSKRIPPTKMNANLRTEEFMTPSIVRSCGDLRKITEVTSRQEAGSST